MNQIKASTSHEIDSALAFVRDAAPAFAALRIAERIVLVDALQTGYLSIAEESVATACAVKKISSDTHQAAEEWGTGPWAVMRHLRLLREQLMHLAATGTTKIGAVRNAEDGRSLVNVFPTSILDRVLFKSTTIDVRMLEGITTSDISNRASFYRAPVHNGRVVLVLGVGNIASVGPMDILTKLFNEGWVCILKMNPVNAYLGPFFEKAFASAIRAGYLAIVYGGTEVGKYLANHRLIDEIHLTGSDETYDAIIWGPPGPERVARKQAGTPVCAKPVTAELGNVSPVLIVPGPYTERELAYQAEDLTGAMTVNAAFLCNAARCAITPAQWPARARFLAHLQQHLRNVPARDAYYPGAATRWHSIVESHCNAVQIGAPRDNVLPWTLITDLDSRADTEDLFVREQFCAVLSETSVGSADPLEYLEAAVDFANSRLWGTLSATIIVHPQQLRDSTIAAAVERAIARLRYGTVAINGFSGISYASGVAPWGAFPGATAQNIQSGNGWVHNTPMLEGIEKAIIRFPLTQFPKPPYFPSHRGALPLLRAMVQSDRTGSWLRLPSVLLAAMRA